MAERLPRSFTRHFQVVESLLYEWQWLWREVPFKTPQLSWYQRYPHWEGLLQQISDERLDELAADPAAMAAFARQVLGITLPDYADYGLRDEFPVTGASSPPEGIRSRKWQQLERFARVRATVSGGETDVLVEWCAGKGHLSRRLLQGRKGRSVALERNPVLVREGERLAAAEGMAVTFRTQDVLAADVARFCTRDSQHVALHACGRLHLSMLRHCAEGGVAQLDLVPCCYHQAEASPYQPLSRYVRDVTRLDLDYEALKLAVQETVAAPPNARRQRRRLQEWRLGFDSLLRNYLGYRDYLPVPSLSPSAAGGDFQTFCRRVAALKGVSLPDVVDYAHMARLGRERFARVSREDLVRQLFRRPLELWLVYDRCLYLEENGYRVALRGFCPRRFTPRNLWIHARRAASS